MYKPFSPSNPLSADAQLVIGYDSSNDFRNAFTKTIRGASSTTQKNYLLLKFAWLDTLLGPMLAIADESKLYVLEFIDKRGLKQEVVRLGKKLRADIVPGEPGIIKQLRVELAAYFTEKHSQFSIPVHLVGSPFHKNVWQALKTVPVGKTCSYLEIAKLIGRPTAYRAVAKANGANPVAIIIPCHRIINTNGKMGGYSGGLSRKHCLLQHEKQFKQ